MSWLRITAPLALALGVSAVASGETLPPLDELLDRTRPEQHLVATAFRFRGNAAIESTVLEAVARSFLGRPLLAEDLVELRERISQRYAEAGFATSYALIPPQDAKDGVVAIEIHEAVLGLIEVRGSRRFSDGYLERRIEAAVGETLHVGALERGLRALQADPRIRSVHAQVLPGAIQGEDRLIVQIEEERPMTLGLASGNSWSPSIGELGGQLYLGLSNPLRHGDWLRLTGEVTSGLGAFDATYELPLTASDTTLVLNVRRGSAEIVESPFDDLAIKSESVAYELGFRHPFQRTGSEELWLGLSAELQRSKTRLLGERFAFSRGADDGGIRTTALRATQEWTSRSRQSVVALRSQFTVGLDALGATNVHRRGAQVPGPRFFQWLGQFQWIQRLPERWFRSQLLTRADIQLSADPLHPAYQISIGGQRTVRGYRRNRLVRDNGVTLSAELRVPLLQSPLGRDLLQLAPFMDFGHGWNDEKTIGPKTLSSAGLGLIYQPDPRLAFSLYWAGRIRNLERAGGELQDHGLHFSATWLAF